MKTIITLVAFAQLYIGTAAHAQGDLIALQAAIQVRDQFVTALEKKDFTEMTHQSMGNAIEILAQDLIDTHSDVAMAQKIRKIWNQNQSVFFTASFHDIGDHAPMIPKIEDFLKQLADKYGTIILTLPVVQDIRTLNFAIPVVFHPKGEWQSAEVDNRIEYRKHFIPFANIVTYYGALIACNYFAAKSEQPEMKKICRPAADKLKFAMGRYIAPPISDWIFNQSNRTYVVSSEARVYNTPEELRAAIQKDLGE